MPSNLFNKPWMEALDPGLLIRYWEKKDPHGKTDLIYCCGYGLYIRIKRYPFGTVSTLLPDYTPEK